MLLEAGEYTMRVEMYTMMQYAMHLRRKGIPGFQPKKVPLMHVNVYFRHQPNCVLVQAYVIPKENTILEFKVYYFLVQWRCIKISR